METILVLKSSKKCPKRVIDRMDHHFRLKSIRLSYRHRTEAILVLKCYSFLACFKGLTKTGPDQL